MAADDEKDSITVGEIARHLVRIEEGIRDLRVAMGEYVLKAVHDAQLASTNNRVAEVERDVEHERRLRREMAANQAVWLRWALGLAVTSAVSVLGLIVAIVAT